MRQEDISAFQSLFTESVADRPIGSVDDARYALENDFNGDPSSRLFELTITTVDTGFSIKTLRDLEKHFTLAGVIDGTSGEIAEVLSHICAHTPGVANPDGSQIRSGPLVPGEQAQHVQTFIKPFDSDDWIEAVLLGRLFAVIGQYPCINAQTRAVADAAVRLKASGFSLSIELGIVQISRPEMERITTRVGVSLRQLGLYDALANVIGLASDNYKYAYDQFLFGRRYGSGLGNRAPSLPVGFLYNLAVKAPSHSALAVPNRNKVWQDAVELARDFLAVLDLEPYSQFAMLGVDATRLENSLRRVAQYDHCFGLRQWQLSFTVEFLEIFFDTSFDADLQASLGWTVQDAVRLVQSVSQHAAMQTTGFVVDQLTIGSGLNRGVLYAMLPFFAHAEGSVNRGYRSPFDTGGTDVIFKPLLRIGNQHLLLPTASVLGPAFFEAIFAALKKIRKDDALAKLRGDGTELLTKHVFGKRGLRPTLENAIYDMPGVGAGECDLVFEDNDNIFFVECKAKALTRGAMTGVQGDALLDFAGGLFASQAQALRHERILRSVGCIRFGDGTELHTRDRRITRLSVTLMDHGALQDRWMLRSVHEALLSSQVTCDPHYSRKKQVSEFNTNLKSFQDETRLLVAAGREINAHVLNVGSASITQLDVILEGVADLSEARTRLTIPMTYNSYNVLLEHFQYSSALRQSSAPI